MHVWWIFKNKLYLFMSFFQMGANSYKYYGAIRIKKILMDRLGEAQSDPRVSVKTRENRANGISLKKTKIWYFLF